MQSQENSALLIDQVIEDEGEVARLVSIWQRMLQQLEAEKVRIVEEIGAHPHPIPACDAQFNGLLEERAAILGEYWQVKGVLKESHSAGEYVEYLDDFVRSSHYLSSEQSLEFQELLNKAGAER